jgi:hypothetical protein
MDTDTKQAFDSVHDTRSHFDLVAERIHDGVRILAEGVVDLSATVTTIEKRGR